MWLLKKLVNWFEDLLWTQAAKDVSENPEYYCDNAYKDTELPEEVYSAYVTIRKYLLNKEDNHAE